MEWEKITSLGRVQAHPHRALNTGLQKSTRSSCPREPRTTWANPQPSPRAESLPCHQGTFLCPETMWTTPDLLGVNVSPQSCWSFTAPLPELFNKPQVDFRLEISQGCLDWELTQWHTSGFEQDCENLSLVVYTSSLLVWDLPSAYHRLPVTLPYRQPRCRRRTAVTQTDKPPWCFLPQAACGMVSRSGISARPKSQTSPSAALVG